MSLSDPAPSLLRPSGDATDPRHKRGLRGWQNRLIKSRKFQKWAARFPLTRGLVRRDGAAIFDVMAGFCHSQVLAALIGLDVLARLRDGPRDARDLARLCDVPPDRMAVLLRAGAALDLLRMRRRGRFALSRRGAAVIGVPGLAAMIRHHDILYRDLADPVAFFRGETTPELAGFWPYVFGAAQAGDPDTSARYSTLMAESQVLVADDTLRAVRLKSVSHLVDVGGGTGTFLTAVAREYPDLKLTLFDLPAVIPQAASRFESAGLAGRVTLVPGSFRDDPLPTGADAISLVRVLYDHSDDTVRALLAAVHAALPPGGRLLISEPMGGARAGDAYYAIYTLAMGTGRTRPAGDIADLCRAAGFGEVRIHRSERPYVTQVVTATRA